MKSFASWGKMKKLMTVLGFSVLFSASALAAPAMQFSCIGSEEYASDPAGVKFKIIMSDWLNGKGYTYMAALFEESTYSPEEISLLPKEGPSDCTGGTVTLPTLVGSGSVYKFSLDDGDCGGVPSLKINAYCTKD